MGKGVWESPLDQREHLKRIANLKRPRRWVSTFCPKCGELRASSKEAKEHCKGKK